jgi:hypothetical protein
VFRSFIFFVGKCSSCFCTVPKGRGNTKNGNKYLAWAYIKAANFAVRYNPQIKRYYQRKCSRTSSGPHFGHLAFLSGASYPGP